MQAAHTVCTYAPHTIRGTGFWTEHWFGGRSHSSLGVRDFQKECQIWTRLTIEHFSTLKQSILNEPWPTENDGASGPRSHMAYFLHDFDIFTYNVVLLVVSS